MYGNREFVSAYECFKPAYEKVVGDMQRVLARNIEFEANKLAQKQRVPIAAAKERVQNIRAHAQQVMDQFDRLMRDLESKPLVRAYIKKGGSATCRRAASRRTASRWNRRRPLSIARMKRGWKPAMAAPVEVVCGESRYVKAPYAPPEMGSLYSVRDKAKGERIIRVIAIDSDGGQIQVEILEEGNPSKAADSARGRFPCQAGGQGLVQLACSGC